MSWTETKWALNRSLGMSDFMPLDEKIEKTQDMILPAGMGDFSRTAVEYSNMLTAKRGGDVSYKTFFVLNKLLAPITGIYKFDFDYKALQEFLQFNMNIYSYSEQRSLQRITSNGAIIYIGNSEEKNYLIHFVGETFSASNFSELVIRNVPFKTFVVPVSINIEKHATLYFRAEKGQALLLTVDCENYKETEDFLQVKNQKVTY